MSGYFNEGHVIGYLKGEPALRTKQNGKSFATFTLRYTERRKKGNGETAWDNVYFNFIVWSESLAELVAKTLHDKSHIHARYKYGTNTYEKDGVKITAPQFILLGFTYLDSTGNSSSESSSAAQENADGDQSWYGGSDDDLPF